jgi:hypothetical protein
VSVVVEHDDAIGGHPGVHFGPVRAGAKGLQHRPHAVLQEPARALQPVAPVSDHNSHNRRLPGTPVDVTDRAPGPLWGGHMRSFPRPSLGHLRSRPFPATSTAACLVPGRQDAGSRREQGGGQPLFPSASRTTETGGHVCH